MKFISSTGGAENFFANVSIGYAQGMYYLSSSGLECKVEKQATIDAKNFSSVHIIEKFFASIVACFSTLHSSPDEDR